MSDPTLSRAGDELAGTSCPYCRFPLKQGAEVVVCSACAAPHHADCWHDNGGCAVFACEGGHAPTSTEHRSVATAATTSEPLSGLASAGKRRRLDGLGLSPTVAVLVLAVLVLGAALLITTSNGKTSAPHPQPIVPTRSARDRSVPAPVGASSEGWPRGFAGFTVALASDLERPSAVGAVGKARSAGLPRVGILVSANYASLTPGYLFVFSGVYASASEAQRHVSKARRAGFSDAYVRRVTE
jgi:hypothetical protein